MANARTRAQGQHRTDTRRETRDAVGRGNITQVSDKHIHQAKAKKRWGSSNLFLALLLLPHRPLRVLLGVLQPHKAMAHTLCGIAITSDLAQLFIWRLKNPPPFTTCIGSGDGLANVWRMPFDHPWRFVDRDGRTKQVRSSARRSHARPTRAIQIAAFAIAASLFGASLRSTCNFRRSPPKSSGWYRHPVLLHPFVAWNECWTMKEQFYVHPHDQFHQAQKWTASSIGDSLLAWCCRELVRRDTTWNERIHNWFSVFLKPTEPHCRTMIKAKFKRTIYRVQPLMASCQRSRVVGVSSASPQLCFS